MAKVKVSERAIIARINRALADRDMVLRTARTERMRLDMGSHWYVVNTRINGIMQYYKGMDLEEIARECGVLKDYERVEI